MNMPCRGRVTGSFQTRGGERIYLIAWDDGRMHPPVDVHNDGEFKDGQRVRLDGHLLRAEGARAPA